MGTVRNNKTFYLIGVTGFLYLNNFKMHSN